MHRLAAPRLQVLDKAAEALGRPEAEILAGHVFECTRAELYRDPESPVFPQETALLDDLVAQRLSGRPLQYITGTQWFRGLALSVGPGVLVPRPETELVVEECLAILGMVPKPKVIDIGTGSGAIALSLATERPDARVWATEISKDALRWARVNLKAEDAPNLDLFLGDLFAGLPRELMGKIDLVVSNPPYLSEKELSQAPVDVREHEPAIALACAEDGLEIPARIVLDALAWLAPGGWLVMETSPTRADALRELLAGRYEQVSIQDDLAGRARIARARRPA